MELRGSLNLLLLSVFLFKIPFHTAAFLSSGEKDIAVCFFSPASRKATERALLRGGGQLKRKGLSSPFRPSPSHLLKPAAVSGFEKKIEGKHCMQLHLLLMNCVSHAG